MPESHSAGRSAPAAPLATPPAWLLIDVMAHAICDQRWGEWHPEDGPQEAWLDAKEGDVAATRDDMATALFALDQRGILRFDWDAEAPT